MIPFLPPLLIVLIVVEFVCRPQMVAMLVSSIFGPRALSWAPSSVLPLETRLTELNACLPRFYVRHWVCVGSVISRGMSRRLSNRRL